MQFIITPWNKRAGLHLNHQILMNISEKISLPINQGKGYQDTYEYVERCTCALCAVTMKIIIRDLSRLWSRDESHWRIKWKQVQHMRNTFCTRKKLCALLFLTYHTYVCIVIITKLYWIFVIVKSCWNYRLRPWHWLGDRPPLASVSAAGSLLINP